MWSLYIHVNWTCAFSTYYQTFVSIVWALFWNLFHFDGSFSLPEAHSKRHWTLAWKVLPSCFHFKKKTLFAPYLSLYTDLLEHGRIPVFQSQISSHLTQNDCFDRSQTKQSLLATKKWPKIQENFAKMIKEQLCKEANSDLKCGISFALKVSIFFVSSSSCLKDTCANVYFLLSECFFSLLIRQKSFLGLSTDPTRHN